MYNLYGPAECTLTSVYHKVSKKDILCQSIPIGKPLTNNRCLVVDEYSQPVIVDQAGELLVGGTGVFAGYLGRDDLTKKALCLIDGEIYYRTGDLVRYDHDGLLYYLGRKDHQIKLRGQRIELGEIERCLLDCSSRVTACVVTKHGDHHLVAYVQSDDVDEHTIREHCQSHLPPFMVPSMFVVMTQLPLNANGKLDRSLLPQPNFASHSSSSVAAGQDTVFMEPSNEMERRIHSLWCELLQCDRISTRDSIFTIGGHSLLLIQLYHHYKTMCACDTNAFGIAQLFQYPTIADHARLITTESASTKAVHEAHWFPLNIAQGIVERLIMGVV